MKYRTKPVEIEAIEYTGDNLSELQKFTDSLFYEVDEFDSVDDPEIVAEIYDRLHATWVGVKLGQYIIRGMKGEYYPCDPEIFAEKYEPVE